MKLYVPQSTIYGQEENVSTHGREGGEGSSETTNGMKKLLIVLSLCVASTLVSSIPASSEVVGSNDDGIYVIRKDKATTESSGMTTIIVASPDKVITEDGEGFLVVGGDDDTDEIKVIKAKKTGAYLGIYMEELTKRLIRKREYPHKKGVMISEIVAEGPADDAGLEANDIIYVFDGEKIDCPVHLSSLVNGKDPGDEVALVFYRDGKKIETTATLGERETEYSSLDWDEFDDFTQDIGRKAHNLGRALGYYWKGAVEGRGKLGLKLMELNTDLAGYFKVDAGAGVLVLEVMEDSPAEEAGIKAGDVVVKIAGEEVSDVDDFIEAVSDVDEEEEIEVGLVRKGKNKTVTVELDEDWAGSFLFSPSDKHIQLEIPPVKLHDIERIEKVEIEKEMKELRKELKRMEKRLEDLEKE